SSKETFVMFNQNIDQDLDWTVYDQLGKVVDKGRISKGNQGFVIDNSNYADGVYAVKITDGMSVLFKKLMVTH
ncbi:MAG TPA: T9SS type A sorting domain-containing protein, partial [Cytophagaceae bacterium]|nr:T9SS type A sorting domain-containing protein [Cytophagaceae bacterium]